MHVITERPAPIEKNKSASVAPLIKAASFGSVCSLPIVADRKASSAMQAPPLRISSALRPSTEASIDAFSSASALASSLMTFLRYQLDAGVHVGMQQKVSLITKWFSANKTDLRI